MDAISFVNQEIMKLWETCEKELRSVNKYLPIPLIYNSMERDVLLFIGSNPSFIPDKWVKILKKTNFKDIPPEFFLNWSNRADFGIDEYQAFEKEIRKERPYFSVFEKISEDVGVKWEHIDLFFYRKTKQNDFKKQIYQNEDLSGFVRSQLALSKKLIYEVQPKVIVVANKFASDIFREEFDLKWDKEWGYYLAYFESRSIPVFLASMLSGQRAMDVYSRERLIWHIKKALKHFA
ncbi:MAG: hypothetical protein V1767_01375 [Chloroflexota bacterium]